MDKEKETVSGSFTIYGNEREENNDSIIVDLSDGFISLALNQYEVNEKGDVVFEEIEYTDRSGTFSVAKSKDHTTYLNKSAAKKLQRAIGFFIESMEKEE